MDDLSSFVSAIEPFLGRKDINVSKLFPVTINSPIPSSYMRIDITVVGPPFSSGISVLRRGVISRHCPSIYCPQNSFLICILLELANMRFSEKIRFEFVYENG